MLGAVPLMRINPYLVLQAGVVAALICLAVPPAATAQSWGGLYNMDGMLRQGHPFARQARPVPVVPQAGRQPVRRPTVAPAAAAPRRTAPAAQSEMPAADDSWKFSSMFSEIRVGAFMHDTGPFSASDEGGVDANVELLFASPGIFDFMWSPRPHIGVSYSASGDTSQAYTGLTWEWSFWSGWFAGFGLGGMIHDGHLVGVDGKSKSLGCRFLFRESINAGYRFNKRHALMVHIDHSSNASLCEKNTSDGSESGRHTVVVNEGIESVGMRYGYMF